MLTESLAFPVAVVQRPSFRRPSSVWSTKNSDPKPDNEIPNMDWLTDSLARKSDGNDTSYGGVSIQDGAKDMADDPPFMEEFDRDDSLGDAPLPSTGISVADEMQRAQAEHFFTELVPVVKGVEKGIKVAQLVTTATKGSFEPVRYLLGISKISGVVRGAKTSEEEKTAVNDFVMVDIPPFTPQLKKAVEQYLSLFNGRLAAALVTSRDCIHYNDAPGVYTIRRADLEKWTKAFPDMAVVAYRLDIPRDCQQLITQRLDGYGPFALEETISESNIQNFTFIESGRPLTYDQWDHDVSENIFSGKQTPPDDDDDATVDVNEDDPYSPAAIRAREDGKRILAIYTPGRTYGSMSYVFPEIRMCASGFTIPVEDSRNDQSMGMSSTGPAMDCRGYITTTNAGISRQTESARNLITKYIDRITILLPSRGDPVFLDGNTRQRQGFLLDIVEQYEKIGKIYEQLGITSRDDDLDI